MSLPRYRFLLATVMFMIRVYIGFILLVPSLYKTTISTEFGVSLGLTGFLTALIMFPGLVIPLMGPVISKVGAKNSGLLAIGIITITGYLIGFSQSFAIATISRLLMGFGVILAVPAFSPMIMTWFTEKEYGRVNAIIESSTSVGIALNFALTPILFPPPLWREAHMVYSTLALALTVIWLALGRNPYGKVEKEKGKYFEMLKSSLARLFGIREVVLMGGILFIAMGVTMAISDWVSTFLADERGYDLQSAALAIVVYDVFNLVSWPAGGFLSDKVGLRRPFLMAGGFMAFVSIFLATTTPYFAPPLIVYILMGLFGFFNAVYGFATATILMEHPKIDAKSIPYAVSIILWFGFIGGAVMPAVVGLISDITGSIYYGLLLCSFFYILVAVFGLLSRETGWKATKK
nr:MFS transporter [Candidatus Njordarchaeota archaeon]